MQLPNPWLFTSTPLCGIASHHYSPPSYQRHYDTFLTVLLLLLRPFHSAHSPFNNCNVSLHCSYDHHTIIIALCHVHPLEHGDWPRTGGPFIFCAQHLTTKRINDTRLCSIAHTYKKGRQRCSGLHCPVQQNETQCLGNWNSDAVRYGLSPLWATVERNALGATRLLLSV